jgi:signal transduction histidine kinase
MLTLRRFLFAFYLSALIAMGSYAQKPSLGELMKKLEKLPADSPAKAKADLYILIANDLTYNNPDSALVFSEKALHLSDSLNYLQGLASSNLSISKLYYVKGGYDQSLSAAVTGLKWSEKINYKQGIATAYNNIGLIYLAQDKFDDAIREFRKSLEISAATGNQRMQMINYFNLGLSFDEKGESDNALESLEKSLALYPVTGDERMKAMILNRMGETYFGTGNYTRALGYYRQVTENNSYRDRWELSFAYSGIAQSLYEQGLYREAIPNAEKALGFAKLLNAKWDIERSLKILYRSHEAVGNYQNAFEYLRLDKIYSDSLYSEAKEKEINSLHLAQKQVENDQLQKQNELKGQQLEAKQKTILIITIFTLFLLALSVITFILYRQKSLLNSSLEAQSRSIAAKNELITKQNAELEQVNYTKDQLFSIIGHDLRSPFSSILQAIKMIRENELSAAETKLLLDSFYEKLNATSSMLDNLVLWAQGQQQGIKINPQNMDLASLSDHLLKVFEFMLQGKDIRVRHDITDEREIFCDPDHARIIIHNILGNAVKFTPVNGLIHIFYTSSQDMLTIHIRDNGIGMDDDKVSQLFSLSGKDITSYGTNKEKGIGIGLILVKDFATENGASIEVKSKVNEGTEFRVSFKRSEVLT